MSELDQTIADVCVCDGITIGWCHLRQNRGGENARGERSRGDMKYQKDAEVIEKMREEGGCRALCQVRLKRKDTGEVVEGDAHAETQSKRGRGV